MQQPSEAWRVPATAQPEGDCGQDHARCATWRCRASKWGQAKRRVLPPPTSHSSLHACISRHTTRKMMRAVLMVALLALAGSGEAAWVGGAAAACTASLRRRGCQSLPCQAHHLQCRRIERSGKAQEAEVGNSHTRLAPPYAGRCLRRPPITARCCSTPACSLRQDSQERG